MGSSGSRAGGRHIRRGRANVREWPGIAQGTAAAALVYRAVIAMGRGDWDAAARFAVGSPRGGRRRPRRRAGAGCPDRRRRCPCGDPSRRPGVGPAHISPMPSGCDHCLTRAPRVGGAGHGSTWLTHISPSPTRQAHGPSLAEIRDILVRRPQMGALVDEVATIQRQVDTDAGVTSSGRRRSRPRSCRLLPLLTTHLSVPGDRQRSCSSRTTRVKTQAISIYRKLDASSRSEAIERAVEVGLLESTAPAQRFIPSG